MGRMLAALQQLQSVERQLATVRSRLDARRNAVAAQEKRIAQLQADWKALHDKAMTRRRDADRLELDLKTREEQVAKLRTALNTAKTNKEYAALLTQINTIKADNAKLEDEVLKIMQEVDGIRAQGGKVEESIRAEEKRLEETKQSGDAEVARLSGMMEELKQKRAEAAAAVPGEALAVFDRIAETYGGEAMAIIEVHGKRAPHDYVCGGCFMALTAEHANALRTRDEIRRCDNCGRILYMEPKGQTSPAQ